MTTLLTTTCPIVGTNILNRPQPSVGPWNQSLGYPRRSRYASIYLLLVFDVRSCQMRSAARQRRPRSRHAHPVDKYVTHTDKFTMKRSGRIQRALPGAEGAEGAEGADLLDECESPASQRCP